MKPDNPITRDDGFNGDLFVGNKRTGELFISRFEDGLEVDRRGPVDPAMITPDLVECLPPSWTKEGAN